jgi:hypothetical protein
MNGLQASEEFLIDNAIEKKLKLYTNLNVEIDDRTTNNRFQLLLQDEFHGDTIANTLNKHKQEIKNSMLDKSFIQTLLSKVNY